VSSLVKFPVLPKKKKKERKKGKEKEILHLITFQVITYEE
jgi:hypothetical protein